MALKIVFMGTPDFSVPTLKAIVEAGHNVVAVYSQPPRPAGRGMAEVKSPVHQAAEALSIPVFTPKSLKEPAEQAAFASLKADAAVVVAYGLLLPQAVLTAPRLGCLNGHASKLPRWRGAAPIQRAIMAGDTETAMMIMRMEEGLDTGPICLSETVAITPTMMAIDLHNQLRAHCASLMVKALALLERGALPETPQPVEGITYAAKISKAEGQINFDLPAHLVAAHIQGLWPSPGAWFEVAPSGGKPERIKIMRALAVEGKGEPGACLDDELKVACRDGAVQLSWVQRPGKKPMPVSEFLRGFTIAKGTRLASRKP